jgi:hypothetical protein
MTREAELLEQAARVDVPERVVRQAVLDRIAARKADPAFQAAVRRAVKANQRVFERLSRRDRPLPLAGGLPSHRRLRARPAHETVVKAVRLTLPSPRCMRPAGWGGVEFYPSSR